MNKNGKDNDAPPCDRTKCQFTAHAGSRLPHSILLLLSLLLSVLLCPPAMVAQDNPYKIDNECYRYFMQIQKQMDSPRFLSQCDTLFRLAAQRKELKAQCMALDLRCLYYSNKGDIQSLTSELKKVKKFVTPTPYKQYLYHCWGLLAGMHNSRGEIDGAVIELSALRDHALEHQYLRGVSQAYTSMGVIYHNTGSYQLAENAYHKALETLHEAPGNLNPYDLENKLAHTLAAQNKNKEAMYYHKQALNHTPQSMIFTNLSLYFSFLLDNPELTSEAETDSVFERLRQYRNEMQPNQSKRDVYYRCAATYYCKKSEWQKARTYTDSISNEGDRISSMNTYFVGRQQWDSAYVCVSQIYQNNYKGWIGKNSLSLTRLLVQSDSARMKAENQRLRILQLEANEKLRSTELEKKELELNNKSQALVLQKQTGRLAEMENSKNKLELEHQRLVNEKLEQEKEEMKKRGLALGGSLGGLLIMAGMVIMVTRRSKAKVKAEKAVVVKALAETEQARVEATKAQQRAEQADSLKSLFLQNMSHEIRTPLNAIIGFNEVLNGGDSENIPPEEKKEYVNIINTNSTLLLTLVNDILDISKLESGTYKLQLSETPVVQLCSNTLASVQGRQKEGVELRMDTDAELNTMLLRTDAPRVQQVLTNFLTNACKNTMQGSITLSARRSVMREDGRPCIEFSVTDTGCGIPPEKAEAIFGRFEKLDSFKQGTGLGLNICRLIASLLHCEVYLDTSYSAGGARFVLNHPLDD